MNKLDGFYELDRVGLPSVPWKKYDSGTEFDRNILWTIRSAVLRGNDLNLPRKVGVMSDEAKEFAESLMKLFSEDDLILYYPYFIAEKSGVMEVSRKRIVIEAVRNDLWNLVTLNNKDITVIFEEDEMSCLGNKRFFDEEEISELVGYSKRIKMKFRNILNEDKSVFLEWSYSFVSDINKNPVGEKRLVFYEIRSVV